MLLSRLNTISINPNLKVLAKGMNTRNFTQIKNIICTINNEYVVVGASRLHYACYHMQCAYNNQQYAKMIGIYPKIVEAIIEFKRVSGKLISDFKSKFTNPVKGGRLLMILFFIW